MTGSGRVRAPARWWRKCEVRADALIAANQDALVFVASARLREPQAVGRPPRRRPRGGCFALPGPTLWIEHRDPQLRYRV